MRGLERIDKIVDDMVDVKADLENGIKSRDARIDDLEKKVEDVVNDTSTLLNETKSKSANFVEKLNENTITGRINDLESKLEDVVSDTSTLLNETKSNNANINKKMIEKDARINEIENKLDNFIAANTSLSAELKAKKSYIENLETKLNVFNDRLTALNEKFNTNRNDSEISPSKSKNKIKNTNNMVKIITAELADLVNAKKDEVLKCEQIKCRLWKYIKTKNLQDPQTKRMFTPYDKLEPIFGKNRMSRRSMNKLIESHILKML